MISKIICKILFIIRLSHCASEYFEDKIYTLKYTDQELLDAIHEIKIDDMYLPKEWFQEPHIFKSFVYGNIDDDILNFFETKFNALNYGGSITKNNKIMKLDEGEENIYIRKTLNKADDNYVIYLFFEIGTVIKNATGNWKEIILCISLIDIHVREKFFSQLRTIEQYGYIVKSFLQSFRRRKRLVIRISLFNTITQYHSNKIEKRIKQFVKDMYIELKQLNDKQLK